MSRYKKKPYVKKTFESTGKSSDTSANIYMSMLMSMAWQKLTARQCKLYLYCKAQYYGEKSKSLPKEYRDNLLAFTMNQSKWCGLYGLYTKSNAKYYYQDMDALISYGFIRCLESGVNTRTKSVYEFSDKWQKYGTPEFDIKSSEMTKSLLNKSGRGLKKFFEQDMEVRKFEIVDDKPNDKVVHDFGLGKCDGFTRESFDAGA